MKLIKGLYRDNSLEEQPNATWVGGKNLIYSNKYSELINEPGFSDVDFTPSGTVIGIVPLSTEYIIFQILDSAVSIKNSEIGILRNGQYQRILRANLHFNNNYPIFGQAYYNYNSELIVAFSDNHNRPKIVNLDNLPFLVTSDKDKNIINDEDTFNLDMFSSFTIPKYHLDSISESGGNLYSGVYFITIQYELPDGQYGNFLHLSNAIYIIVDSSNKPWHLIGAGEPNTITSKSINIVIADLDTRYNKIRFGIVHQTSTLVNSYVSNPYSITSGNNQFNISSTVGLAPADLTDILVKSSYYNKIGTMLNLDNTLWIANLEIEQDIKYQKYANNIKVEYVYEEEISLNGFKGSHKDPVILFDKKGFMPNEIYAFYIRWHYKGGSKVTEGFHIPGRALLAGEDNTVIGNSGFITPFPKKYQFYDTCDNFGRMNAWENIGEAYPLENDKPIAEREYNGEVDYQGQVIANGSILNGKKVRHHKFPSLAYLAREKGFIKEIESGVTEGILLMPLTIIEEGNYSKTVIFRNTSVPYNYMSDNNTKFTNISGSPITVNWRVNLGASFSGSHDNNPISINSTFTVTKGTSTSESQVFHAYSNINTTIYHLFRTAYSDSYSEVVLQPGEYIKVKAIAKTMVAEEAYSISGSFSGAFYIKTMAFNIEKDGTIASKILGIRLKNIYISQEVKDKCESFEILYAERSGSNISVLGQGLFTKNYSIPGSPYGEFNRFYAYDLLSVKRSVNITHLVHDLDFVKPVNVSYEDPMYISPTQSNDNIYPSFGSKYVSANIMHSDTPLPNLHQDEYLYVNIQPAEGENPVPIINPDNNDKLVTAMSFSPSVYLGFINQKLIRTGKLISITNLAGDSTILNTNPIYGGDVNVNLHGVTQIHYLTSSGRISYILYPCYSIFNIGYRYEGKSLNETFFPAFNFIINSSELLDDPIYWRGLVNEYKLQSYSTSFSLWQILIDAFGYTQFYDMPEYYPNLDSYNKINSLEVIPVFDYDVEFSNVFPYRIHKSLIQQSENKNQNWRIFNYYDYYESNFNRGSILKLLTDGQDLLIQHEYSLFVVRNIQQLNISEDVVTSLTNSELFSSKAIEIVHDNAGYVGCASRFGALSFKYGVVIVDRYKGKIFLYNNLKVIDISALGLEEFFFNNLQYSKELHTNYIYTFDDGQVVEFDDQEFVEYANPTDDQFLQVDNPYTKFGIFVVWDDKNSRLLFTKTYFEDNVESSDSFTISYYPEIHQWGFFHDYTPNMSISNRTGLYHLKNNNLYKGNNLTKLNYYFNTYYPFYIDVVFNTPFNIDKLYQSIEWATKVFVYDKEAKVLSFTKIRMFNDTRDSNDIELPQNFNTESVRFAGGTWNFNYIRDKLIKDILSESVNLNSKDILITEGKKFHPEWHNWSLFTDTNMVVRLSFDIISNYSEYRDYINTLLGIPEFVVVPKINFKILNITANYNLITR